MTRLKLNKRRRMRRKFSQYKIPRVTANFPDVLVTKQRVTIPININSSSGLIQKTVYGNHFLDCEGTGGAGAIQPPFVNHLQSVYTNFVVSGCKASLTVSSVGANQTCQVFLIPFTGTMSVNPTYLDEVRDGNSSLWFKSRLFEGNGTTNQVAINKIRNVSLYASTAKIYGCSQRKIMDDTSYSGLCGAPFTRGTAPAKKWSWNIIGGTIPNTSTASFTIIGSLHLTYYVKFSGRAMFFDSTSTS